MNVDMSNLLVVLLASLCAITACRVGLSEGDGLNLSPDDDDAADDDDAGSAADDDDSDPVGSDDDDVLDPVDDDDDTSSSSDDDDTDTGNGGLCSVAASIACGDAISGDTNSGLATGAIDAYACSTWDATGPELAYSFTPTESGPVYAALTDIEEGQDLDIYILRDLGNGCSSDDCFSFANADIQFDVVAGDTYYIVVDGYYGAAGSFALELSCDPVSPGDDDDTVGPGDDDDAATTPEDCADGIDNDADGAVDCADADCANDPSCAVGVCTAVGTLSEGATSTWENNGLGSTSVISSYPCQPNWDESGPEFAYIYVASQSGQATVELALIADELIEFVFGPLDDLDVFVLDGSGACDPSACVAGGDTTVTWNVSAGSTWYIVVDGYQGDVSPYDLTLTLVP
jgi:hypothetical protein